MSDNPEAARKKIMSATTDSLGCIRYDRVNQPGITNLLDILALFTGRSIGEINQEYEGRAQYGPLKAVVADTVGSFLEAFQDKLSHVDNKAIMTRLTADENRMRKQASQTLYKVQKAAGLRP